MILQSALAQALRNHSQNEDFALIDNMAGTLAAGAVNGTWSANGRGERGVVDGNNKLSISGGVANFATGGVANFDPSLVYQNRFPRIPGQVMFATVTLTGGRCQFGWLANTTPTAAVVNGNRRGSFDFNVTTLAIAPSTTGSINVGAIALSTPYICALVQRNAGMLYFIKGGSFINWTLLYIDNIGTSPLLNPYASALGTTGVFTITNIRVLSDWRNYLPSPLISDGFSTWGTTDGFGHQEGLFGTIGAGGNGRSWTANLGTFTASLGVGAASALSGGLGIATVDATRADVIATARVTRSGGNAGIVLRYVDASNYVYAIHNGTNVQLIKRIAGVETTLVDSAATYVANAELRVMCQGSAFRVFYNDLAISTEQTISDSVVATSTRHGLYTTDTGNTFDDFTVYARGVTGEYARLDMLLAPYHILDEFNDDRSVGTIGNTPAEPGPGTRWVQLDTNSKFSIVGGNAVLAAGGAANDPTVRYRQTYNRATGRVVIFGFTVNIAGFECGIDNASLGSPFDAFRMATSVLTVRVNTNTSIAVTTFSTGVFYQVALVQRATGALYFIRGGAFSNWTLLWMSTEGNLTGWHPCFMLTNATGAANVAYVRMPEARWLPSPILSDGFSTWGTSDGLGHAEGQNSDSLGLGGSGLTWTANFGTWGAPGGLAAASVLSGGRAIATVDCGKADLVATVNCTLVGGTMSLVLRWVDENNHIQLRLTATNCQLVKLVAGVSTTVSDAGYTYVAGAEMRIVCQGSAFRRYYNNAAIGAESTIADAALQTSTRIGLRTDNTGNQFDNLRVWSRGSGGEYESTLNNLYSPM